MTVHITCTLFHKTILISESELRKKIETERCETERLRQEIQELQYLRHDSDQEYMSSSSDSSYESEDEDDLQEMLNNLIKDNEELEVPVILTLLKPMEFSAKLHTIKSRCSIVYIEVSQVTISTTKKMHFFR